MKKKVRIDKIITVDRSFDKFSLNCIRIQLKPVANVDLVERLSKQAKTWPILTIFWGKSGQNKNLHMATLILYAPSEI